MLSVSKTSQQREKDRARMTIVGSLLSVPLSDLDQVLLLLLICICLGACFIAVLCDLERARTRWLDQRADRVSRFLPEATRDGERRTPRKQHVRCNRMRRLAAQSIISSILIAAAIWMVMGSPAPPLSKIIVAQRGIADRR
jgi:hypothetical protein